MSPVLTRRLDTPSSNRRFLIICDHASHFVPPELNALGLPQGELERHIAYDIGALEVAEKIAETLECPLVASQFSRLLIDPNRGLDDPTLVMKLSDGSIIPANKNIDPFQDRTAWQHRIDAYYHPYNQAIETAIDAALNAGEVPIILSVHSFTPVWRGQARPWQAAVLWDQDARLRDVAVQVGITERAVQGIVADLVRDGYVDKERVGRRNHYEVHEHMPLRHPLEDDHDVGALLAAIASSADVDS